MNVDWIVHSADQYHRAGRTAEARSACHEALARRPDHPVGLHILGILTAQDGQLEAAAELIQRSVHVRPEYTEAWANLGCIWVHLGKLHEALEAFARVVQLQPNEARFHYSLGIIRRDLGHLDEAIESFTRATELQPDFPEAYLKLGMALRNKGMHEQAIAAYSKAIALKADLADAHNNLANVLRDQRRWDEAVAEYLTAIQLNPTDAVTYLNLGHALSHQEQFPEAVASYERAIELQPDSFEAHNQIGLALANLQQFEKALQSHRRAVALRPDDPRGHETLGATLLLKHDMDAAAESFRRALALGAESATAWNGLGMALQAVGQFEDASDCFRHALAISPEKALFHKNWVTTGRRVADASQIKRLEHLLNRVDLPVDERADAGFALGKLLDDSNRFGEAFAAYAKANRLVKQARKMEGRCYDGAEVHARVSGMIKNFTPAYFKQRCQWGNSSDLPVFIVGMPRSGTTLVEQIAASHPSVFGAGELQDVERAARALFGEQNLFGSAICDSQSIAQAADAYLEHVSSLSGDAVRIIDKMPGNVFHLALIAVMFPRSRVIFCRRDARDNCLSCFFQQFGKKNSHLYGYDLADCARQYLETQRLVAHWHRVLPLRMLEVQYEDLVADQEQQTRRLIEFLDVPWDAACLDFHRTQRTVVTASVWQVRQPMYNRSAGRWRNYAAHLGPLLDILPTT